MSRFNQIAAAAALTFALIPAAFAASHATQAQRIDASSESGSMPVVTVTAGMMFTDYTGVVPAAKAEGAPVWTVASAYDYTGTVPAVTEAQLSSVAVWNAMLVHEFLAQ